MNKECNINNLMNINKKFIMYELRNEADSILKQKYLPEDRPIESILQIIHEPAFEYKVVFELFKSEDEKNNVYYFLVKSMWDKDSDSKKIDIPPVLLRSKYKKGEFTPTIKREKIILDKKYAEEMIMNSLKINISLMPSERVAVCDGTYYTIRINSLYNKCYFKWWEDGPENWSELTTYTKKLLEYFYSIDKES